MVWESVSSACQIPRFVVALVIGAASIGSPVWAESDSSDDSVDHPLIIVAFASPDRALDATVSVINSLGMSMSREGLPGFIKGFAPDAEKLARVPESINVAKPCGLLVFYKAGATKPAPSDNAEQTGSPRAQTDVALDQLYMGSIDRTAMFVSVSDFEQFLAFAELTPVPEEANCYVDSKGTKSYVRRFGDCVVMFDDADLLDHCPDPRGLVKPILGKNDAVFSMQVKGLPPLLRTLGAEGVKFLYDAGLQQRDDESQDVYPLRKAFGALLREMLDLAVLHIDQLNLGARVDPAKRLVTLELETAGEKNGRLSKYAAEVTPRKTPFDSIWDKGFDGSLGLSWVVPERHSKPLATALRHFLSTPEAGELKTNAEMASICDAFCRSIENRQFDFGLFFSGPLESCVSMLAIQLAGGERFPEKMLDLSELNSSDDVKISLEDDRIKNWPVHRLENWVSWTDIFSDGKVPSRYPTWIVFTPQVMWLVTGPPNPDGSIPESARSAIERQAEGGRSTNPQRGRGNLLRMTARLKNILPDDEADSVDTVGYQPGPNGVLPRNGFSLDLQPTDVGLKLTAEFDEYCFKLLWKQFVNAQLSAARHELDMLKEESAKPPVAP